MLGLRPDANTQWNRKPSPKPSSSDSSWANAMSAPISEAISDKASTQHNFGRFMRAPIENAGPTASIGGAQRDATLHWNARGMGKVRRGKGECAEGKVCAEEDECACGEEE